MPMLKPAGAYSAWSSCLAASSNSNMAARSFAEVSKKDSTCRSGITKVCPRVTGNASRTTMAVSLRSSTRLSGRQQNKHVMVMSIRHARDSFGGQTRNQIHVLGMNNMGLCGTSCNVLGTCEIIFLQQPISLESVVQSRHPTDGVKFRGVYRPLFLPNCRWFEGVFLVKISCSNSCSNC